jgi:hypothetical protein
MMGSLPDRGLAAELIVGFLDSLDDPNQSPRG